MVDCVLEEEWKEISSFSEFGQEIFVCCGHLHNSWKNFQHTWYTLDQEKIEPYWWQPK